MPLAHDDQILARTRAPHNCDAIEIEEGVAFLVWAIASCLNALQYVDISLTSAAPKQNTVVVLMIIVC